MKATVTVEQAADILGIGRASAYAAVKAGRIPAIRISPRRIVISITALDRLLGSTLSSSDNDSIAEPRDIMPMTTDVKGHLNGS